MYIRIDATELQNKCMFAVIEAPASPGPDNMSILDDKMVLQ
jgi:hypothetical protein